jgi:hypothetical protein
MVPLITGLILLGVEFEKKNLLHAQPSKIDLWSHFLTTLWALDVGGFCNRLNQFKYIEDFYEAVLQTASNIDTVSKIQEMAVVNPKERASTAQMLVKQLSTRRNQVPALINSPSPIITAARAP